MPDNISDIVILDQLRNQAVEGSHLLVSERFYKGYPYTEGVKTVVALPVTLPSVPSLSRERAELVRLPVPVYDKMHGRLRTYDLTHVRAVKVLLRAPVHHDVNRLDTRAVSHAGCL